MAAMIVTMSAATLIATTIREAGQLERIVVLFLFFMVSPPFIEKGPPRDRLLGRAFM
jgi:hypothetical protein